MKISLSLSNDPSPASLLITDCPVDEYSGLYVFAGQANGRGHWQTSTDVTMHLYWGPQGTWLLRGNFEPTVRAHPRRSSILRVRRLCMAWVCRPLSRPFLGNPPGQSNICSAFAVIDALSPMGCHPWTWRIGGNWTEKPTTIEDG